MSPRLYIVIVVIVDGSNLVFPRFLSSVRCPRRVTARPCECQSLAAAAAAAGYNQLF